MELQIQDLVESIKKDGIDCANKEKEEILSSARAQAEAIIKEAKEQADKTIADAKKEIEVLSQSAKVGVQQASRDVMLSLRQELDNQFSRILGSNLKAVLKEEALVTLISAVVSDKDISSFKVELKEVSEGIKAQLAKEIKEGLEIIPSKNVTSGFRFVEKDGSGYFDFSDETLSNILKPFLSDNLF
ncbi:MAG: V-type ATP synthase subunit E [Sphaerochaetaceae bacterium]|nr:V-type ATP synthase subunit E [Sphaerochaetaceae bacterium]